jgi:FecR protein
MKKSLTAATGTDSIGAMFPLANLSRRRCHAFSRGLLRQLPFCLAVSVIGIGDAVLGADLSQAVVRQKVNVVSVAPNLTSEPRPAAQGAIIHDENVVRTGNESRAELEFSDLTLARLGSNSIFSFDAKSRTLSFTQGAVLFSKPPNSGPIELRSGAITAAITGSTGFISNVPIGGIKKTAHPSPNTRGSTTMVGMLEGKIIGGARWIDSAGREQTTRFRLGPGEMLIAQPNSRPVTVQFDIPRFLKTSPLVKGFSHPLPNAAQLDRAVAEYQSDERRGFIDKTNVMVSSQPVQVAWVGYNSSNYIDASVAQLRANNNGNNGGFLNIGSTGIIRGQLVWDTSADLDLHLTLPDQQQVFFANPSVTFNNGRATARLDHDNTGGTTPVDVPPTTRVENIAINGVPSAGTYIFFANSFATLNASDPFTLRVFYNGTTQVLSGTLSSGQNSAPVTVQVRPGG